LFERQTSGPGQHRAPLELKETHALGKSPQLITPTGRVITERSAIALYLINRYDTDGKFQLNLEDPEHDAVREEELLSLGGASLNPILMTQFVFEQLRHKSPFFIRPLIGSIASMVNKAFLSKENENMTTYLDNELQGRDWFMGTSEPTRADFCLHWYMDMGFQTVFPDFGKDPILKAWLDRCKDRPAWKKALQKGNGYDLMSSMS